ncbi:MAG: TatD family hydrolase [Oscillospiraceae bacterium]|jgi:TatD DNase family protein|nr:TatD family hydrolase [Oscillospiraceae bacterium]
MTLFDTHAHIDDERFHNDRDAVLRRMVEAGVTRCVCIGADEKTSRAAAALSTAYDGLYAAVGVHPESADRFHPSDEAWIKELASYPKTVAVGEIGLDYYYDDGPPRDKQREAFTAQLELAAALRLPAILHVRESHGEIMELLRERRSRLPQIILHCYSGSWESAKIYLSIGCMISFSGSVTFKNASKLREVAANAPLDRILVETDCPYLAPAPMRGKRNEPAFVAHTARRIAEIRDMDVEELAEAAARNALRVFNIPADAPVLTAP